MILSYVFIFANFVTTCAMAHEFHYEVIDEPLKPYVARYVSTVTSVCPSFKSSKNYVIELTEDLSKPEWVGVCHPKVNGFHVQIRESWWKENKSESLRQELIDHELAHCMIYKEHDPSPNNYMYEYLNPIPEEVYILQVIKDIKGYCEHHE